MISHYTATCFCPNAHLLYNLACDFHKYSSNNTLRQLIHEPLTWYVNMQFVHAPGMPGTFSPPPRVSDPDLHHSTCVTHVPWCMSGSLTCGFHWIRWRGKRSGHYRRMRNPQFCVTGERPMARRKCSWAVVIALATAWNPFHPLTPVGVILGT